MKQFDSIQAAQLLDRYPASIAEQIVSEPLMVASSVQPDIRLPYIHVKPQQPVAGHSPILLVPGFGAGIINHASTAAELATRGHEIILPGQNRKAIIRDVDNRRSAAYTQAHNYLDVLDAAVEPGAAVNVVAHSYGSLIFQAMTRLQPGRFEQSDVVLLSPAGSIENETLHGLGRRWLSFVRSEMDNSRPMEFPDNSGATSKESTKTLFANIPRMALEIHDLARKRVDYTALRQVVSSLAVLSAAEDKMFPEDILYPALSQHVQNGDIIWASPVSPERVATGEMKYSGAGATHDDAQFNPSRVCRAIAQIFEQQTSA